MESVAGWGEVIVFVVIFYCIIGIPCFLIVVIGRDLIDKLGRFPSRTPAIQLSVAFKLIVLEIFTFGALIAFHNFFYNSWSVS